MFGLLKLDPGERKWGKWKESEVTQSYPTLCNPMDCSLPGSSIHGIFQTRVLEWVAISFSRGSSQPSDQTQVSHIVGRCFTVWAAREVNSHYTLFYIISFAHMLSLSRNVYILYSSSYKCSTQFLFPFPHFICFIICFLIQESQALLLTVWYCPSES